jgi:hypothetical protein
MRAREPHDDASRGWAAQPGAMMRQSRQPRSAGRHRQRLARLLAQLPPPPPPAPTTSGSAGATAAEESPWAPPEHLQQLGPARVLSEAQRQHFLAHGYLVLPGFVSGDWVGRLLDVTSHFVQLSAQLKPGVPAGFPGSGAGIQDFFVFEPGHTPEQPRLTRLTSPVDLHDTYWEFANAVAAGKSLDYPPKCSVSLTGRGVDVAQDLIGPDVKFHHSKLNFKMGGQVGDGGAVRWHQDIQVRTWQPVLGTGSTDGMMAVTQLSPPR